MAYDPTFIVVLPALREQAEAAAIAADPAGGAGTFVPGKPLKAAGDATNAVAAYWCLWQMAPGQRSAFATALGGPINTIGPGGSVPLNRDRWMFDASEGAWTRDAVMAALGLAVISTPL